MKKFIFIKMYVLLIYFILSNAQLQQQDYVLATSINKNNRLIESKTVNENWLSKFTKNNTKEDEIILNNHTNSKIYVMDEMKNINGKNPPTILPLITETFDFNLDDYEDLPGEKTNTNRSGRKELRRYDEEHFEGFKINEETDGINSKIDQKQNNNNHNNNNNNIFKVSKSKWKPSSYYKRFESKSQTLLSANGVHIPIANHFSNFTNTSSHFKHILAGSKSQQFELLTNLFDHFQWDIEPLYNNLTEPCSNAMDHYLHALRTSVDWAIRASDSSGRYRSQFIFGNDLWMGSKAFCNEINYQYELIKGKNQNNNKQYNNYIKMGFYVLKYSLNLHHITKNAKELLLGECLPELCTLDDIKLILNSDPSLKQLKSTTKENIINFVNVRRVPGDYNILKDKKFQFLSAIIVVFLILIVTATIYEHKLYKIDNNITKNKFKKKNNQNKFDEFSKPFELYQISTVSGDNNNINEFNSNSNCKNNNNNSNNNDHHTSMCDEKGKHLGLGNRILLSFAFVSNSRSILSMKKQSESSITCIHGLRVLSLVWTIMVHTYLCLFNIGENRFRRNISERTFIFQIIGNATFSVDTFFFISGVLVSYIFLKKSDKIATTTKPATSDVFALGKKEKFYNNLFPAYIIRIFILFIYRFIRLTPAYLFVIVFCELSFKKTYNASVFTPGLADHITCGKYWWRNILYINNWYPMREMCMIWSWYLANDTQFYIMAVLILMLATKYTKSALLIIVSFLMSSWVIAALFSIQFNYTHKVAEPFESFDFLYDKPWQRVGPYIMGMFTGFILIRFKSPPKVSPILNWSLWMCSVGLLFSLVFGVWDGELSILTTAFYVSIGHSAWGLSLVWITLSCCWGLSPLINAALSNRLLLPLSRLTYCSYLIHPILMVITAHSMQSGLHLQHILVLIIFIGNVVVSLFAGFIISMMFEAPVIRLLKICFGK